MWRDLREELGDEGVITEPYEFERDGLVHPVNIFHAWSPEELLLIDIVKLKDKTQGFNHRKHRKINPVFSIVDALEHEVVFSLEDVKSDEEIVEEDREEAYSSLLADFEYRLKILNEPNSSKKDKISLKIKEIKGKDNVLKNEESRLADIAEQSIVDIENCTDSTCITNVLSNIIWEA